MYAKHSSLIVCLLTGLLASTLSQAENSVATAAELDSAIAFYRAEGAEKALPEFQQLHASFKQQEDRVNESLAERG